MHVFFNLGIGEFTANIVGLVDNIHFTVVIDPSLSAEQVVHAGGGLVPRVVVLVLVELQLHQTLRLQLHGLAPELGFDANVLPEREVLRLAVAGRDGRVVADL